MEYTQYFKKMKTEKGVPHLSFDQHSRYFNIVAIEFHVDQLQRMNLNSPTIFKHINIYESKLKHITKELSPEELFLELVELSL